MRLKTTLRLLKVALLAGGALLCSAVPCRAQTAAPEVTYEIFVQSFCDSDGDGIGDFQGMTSRLDYLDRLGAQAVWLMPIGPSPSYHKYDVTDYYAVHPDYGTMAEFKHFVEEAHRRDIKVIMDLVVNHTARAHPWFQQALEGEDNPYRGYYVWATDEEIEADATPGGSADPGNWHDAPGPEDYYGFFWGGMPDLNFDNPEVRGEIIEIGRFWLEEVGVDGFRLDAARHIYPDDRAADSRQWWIEFRRAMEDVDEDVYLVGEVWGTTEEAAPYFRGLDALFNFDLALAIQEAVETGVGDSLAILHRRIRDAYRREADSFIDATFLANHDMNRIRSVLGGSLQKAAMAASLLFTLPGDPYVYYGEEIGMLGKKPDPHIREPFLWKADSAAVCRTSWIDPIFSTDWTVIPKAKQAGREGSLLEHYRQLIQLRTEHLVLAEGAIEPIDAGRESISAFLRVYEGDSLLVVHNLASQGAGVRLPAELTGFRRAVWANGGTENADVGHGELESRTSEPETTPAFRDDLLWMPGLSTIVLRRSTEGR